MATSPCTVTRKQQGNAPVQYGIKCRGCGAERLIALKSEKDSTDLAEAFVADHESCAAGSGKKGDG